jgi:hypothetical protein
MPLTNKCVVDNSNNASDPRSLLNHSSRQYEYEYSMCTKSCGRLRLPQLFVCSIVFRFTLRAPYSDRRASLPLGAYHDTHR